MSHYRSETPDLIRFSNDWFYCDGTGKGRLELYPPAHVSGIGRRLHYVRNAVYSETPGQRSNRREAEEVVSLIAAHVRDFPDKSLGVVTMNIPQMELIEDLMVNAPPPVQSFCADDAKFFLRNLETVQGDEMDRIIVSLTYGKNPAGYFSASVLGPLIKKGGERRLNVAVTRSRSGMTVVSSLASADLASSGATSEGFQSSRLFFKTWKPQPTSATSESPLNAFSGETTASLISFVRFALRGTGRRVSGEPRIHRTRMPTWLRQVSYRHRREGTRKESSSHRV